MKCQQCNYYMETPSYNECVLLYWENCRTLEDCNAVNEDQTVNRINYEALKIKMCVGC